MKRNRPPKAKPRIHVGEVEPMLIDAVGLASILNIGRSSVFKLNAAGRIPSPLKVGRATRWSVEDIRKWVELGCPRREVFDTMRIEGQR